MIPRRALGATGLTVTALGFGAMQVGAPDVPDDEAARVLHGVLDLGIRLIDTARSYGDSEVRIGRHLARRRDEFVLSTKVGYGVDGVPDWTYDCVARGIDDARARLRTDVIDVVHLHSCPLETLLHGGVAEALFAAVQAGKVRVAAYSGENAALAHAVETSADLPDGAIAPRAFGAVQTSVNLCESGAEAHARAARARGFGVLAKRPLAGLPWRDATSPADPPHAEYWRRFAAVRDALGERGPDEWADLALRWASYADGVDACLVGGTNLAHLRANVAMVERGPLHEHERAAVRALHARFADAWPGVI
jgi:aryl-alcohol dehydrogenase-like predicted oxidoreductase